MIIFEGPDGGGKTTLIRQFQEAFGLEVSPRVVSKNAEAMTDLSQWVDDNLDRGFQSKIFDRHRLISEPIYGPILRNHPEPNFDNIAWLCPRLERFYQIRPVIVYCLPPLQTVVDNVSDDEDNRSIRHKINSIYSAYVARASLDHSLSHGITKVWNYVESLKIDDKPIWFNEIAEELFNRVNRSK